MTYLEKIVIIWWGSHRAAWATRNDPEPIYNDEAACGKRRMRSERCMITEECKWKFPARSGKEVSGRPRPKGFPWALYGSGITNTMCSCNGATRHEGGGFTERVEPEEAGHGTRERICFNVKRNRASNEVSKYTKRKCNQFLLRSNSLPQSTPPFKVVNSSFNLIVSREKAARECNG